MKSYGPAKLSYRFRGVWASRKPSHAELTRVWRQVRDAAARGLDTSHLRRVGMIPVEASRLADVIAAHYQDE